ncbi:MAG: MBL fold metallo-hydrolase [Polyangiaceae bacterium]|nr:MBL fold metallo-hydrolase [Polyangiaceae bacterium]
MKLQVFRSGKGDCLLLTSQDGKRLLVDGGVKDSFRDYVAPALSALKPARVDAVCVSHIDDDHIGGVLELFENLVAWRVHDYQSKSGNKKHRAPRVPRPPAVKELWHNAFHETIAENSGEIEEMLAAVANAFVDAPKELAALGARHDGLATSVRQGLVLARRSRVAELGVKVNAPAKGKLMLVREGQGAIRLGKMRLHVIGPQPSDLTDLQKEWNVWLQQHRNALVDIRRKAARIEKGFHNAAQGLVESQAAILAGLRDFVHGNEQALAAASAKRLGQRQKVTTPNLASLMLLAEEGRRKVLLTGDGHADDALEGLRAVGKLNGRGVHLDVLKVQHHGSEYNMTEDFAKTVTADHYVFCGNGFATNPELEVIDVLVSSRLSGAGPARPFKLWFNANPAERSRYQAHMKKVKQLVDKLVRDNPRVTAEFIAPGASSFGVI